MTGQEHQTSQPCRVPTAGFLLMFIIVIGLGALAIFANFEHFRQRHAETVLVKPATSSATSAQGD